MALVCCVTCFFPSESILGPVLRFLGVWAVAAYAYRRMCPVGRGGYVALLAFWTLLAVGCTLNAWWFTTASGGTPEAPVLLNDDASLAWGQMQAVLHGEPDLDVPGRRGYGTLLAWLSWGGTPTIGGMLWLNMLATLLTIVLTGAAAARMGGATERRERTRLCTAAMIMTGGVCYLLMSGTILIKDAFCCLMMAMTLYGLYGARGRAVATAVLLAAVLFAMQVRSHLLPFMALAMVAAMWKAGRGLRVHYALLIVVAVAAYAVVRLNTGDMPIDADGTTNVPFTFDSDRLNAYNLVAGDYHSRFAASSALYQLVRLPFSLAVQYLTPLPWAFARDTVFGPSEAWAHVSYPWYALGCIVLFVLLFRLRRAPSAVAGALIFAVAANIFTAYATGGTISRYCLSWVPFLVPAGAWIWCSGGLRCRAFRLWATGYTVVLAVALAVVFYFLHAYSPGGWEVV